MADGSLKPRLIRHWASSGDILSCAARRPADASRSVSLSSRTGCCSTFSPLFGSSRPFSTARAVITRGPIPTTSNLTRPSSTLSVSPTRAWMNSSGWGTQTSAPGPGENVTTSPEATSRGAGSVMRILAPWRSTITGAPGQVRLIDEIAADSPSRSRWEAFTRNEVAPAAARSAARPKDAGPSVATS